MIPQQGTDLKFLSGSDPDEGEPVEECCSTLRTRSVADLGEAREDSASPGVSPIEAVRGPCPNGEKLELAMSTTKRLSSVISNLCFTDHSHTFHDSLTFTKVEPSPIQKSENR